MILGNICTRNCAFCSVPSGKPEAPDADEPQRVAEAVAQMELRHAVVTTVVRDDLPDGGAGHIAETIRAIRRMNPTTTIEILVSDYRADAETIRTIVDAGPEVFSHNIETVKRLYPVVRDRRFGYETSLDVLETARECSDSVIVKSAMMAGHGETAEEVEETLRDLLDAGCEAVCIGQYLRPSLKQREVTEYVPPEKFESYQSLAYALGFGFAVAGPFVRSSYRSEEVLTAPFARERMAHA
jgi:lipoic acid synthetase